MFTIASDHFYGLEKIILSNTRSGECCSVLPAYGGNLHGLMLSKEGALHEVLAGNQTMDELLGRPNNAYRGVKLSPFPNRINKGHYSFEGKSYALYPNDKTHALHGLLWNLPFTVQEQQCTETQAKLLLVKHCRALSSGFPFEYTLSVAYTLEQHRFTCVTTITNTSDSNIPMGDGWHPYFTTGSDISQLKLKLPSVHKIETDPFLIPTGKILHDPTYNQASYLGEEQLDDCFELGDAERIVETHLVDEDKKLQLVLWQKAGPQGYNFVHVYTPPDRRSIAIEPTSCAPDAFNSKNGLIVLVPGQTVELLFGIRLEQ